MSHLNSGGSFFQKEVIMSRIKLDNRLLSVASLVRKNRVVADVGTDHAYVVAYLIEKGVSTEVLCDVMKQAQEIPSRFKINEKNTKYVLREASHKTLPDEWANRTKLGFAVPLNDWLREDKYYNIVKEYFMSDFAAEFFRRDAIMKLLDDHKNGKAQNQRKIWTVFTFLVWYKKFFIEEL